MASSVLTSKIVIDNHSLVLATSLALSLHMAQLAEQTKPLWTVFNVGMN
jgi:hypothetical protein